MVGEAFNTGLVSAVRSKAHSKFKPRYFQPQRRLQIEAVELVGGGVPELQAGWICYWGIVTLTFTLTSLIRLNAYTAGAILDQLPEFGGGHGLSTEKQSSHHQIITIANGGTLNRIRKPINTP